jgi:hypothetical protein
MAERVNFLHIGKTGVSALREALGDIRDGSVVIHPHETSLKAIPVGDRVVFSIRDPISRFVSGFNSRLRKGRPRNYNEWSPEEARAFSVFQTPNQLGEALFAPDAALRTSAQVAMDAILHTRSMKDWLINKPYLASRSKDVAFVVLQSELELDFQRLVTLFNISGQHALPKDEIGAHRAPTLFSRYLSQKAREALSEWYRDDVELYRYCLELRAQRIAELKNG